jgi:hypothetical protein
MKKLQRWNLTHLALKSMVARKILILLFILLSIPFFSAPNAFAGFPGGVPDFGWVLIGTNKCVTATYQNMSPGNTFMCDSNGCSCLSSEVQRTATFTTSGNGFSVTPSGPVVVPGCIGYVNLSCCVSPPGVGDYAGTLTATVSPALNGGYTTESISLHVRGIPSLVTAEPLGSSLNYGSAEVGQTITKTFSVCNYNSFSVTINSISIDNNNFTVASGANAVIPSV